MKHIKKFENIDSSISERTPHVVYRSLFVDNLEPAYKMLTDIYNKSKNYEPIDAKELDKICSLLYEVKHKVK